MQRMLIAGEWVDSEGGGTMVVDNPATGEVVDEVPKGTRADARRAVDAALEAKGRMERLPAWERYKILLKAAQLIEGRLEELARILSLESGKPIRDSRIEVQRASVTFTYAAEEAKRLYGEVYQPDAYPLPPGNENRFVFSIRQPIGVVVAVSPFNFPLNLLCHKVAPALAAGNAVIAKPTSETPLIGLKLGEILVEAGVPKGGINVVTGGGSTVGAELVENPGTDLITFTGSTDVGLALAADATRRGKRVILEMGGMDPLIVLEDANLDKATDAALHGCFGLAGQVCIAVKRIFAVEKVAKPFTETLTKKVGTLNVGNPLEATTDVGPLINMESLHRIDGMVREAVEAGARVTIGGKRLADPPHAKGSFYAPTVLEDVEPEMRLAQEETFGPLGPVQSVESAEEAVERTNASIYGLQSSIYTSDLRKALKLAREIKAGGVMINDPTTIRWDNMPFGGVKQSGYGREGVRFAIQEMTELKLVNINLA